MAGNLRHIAASVTLALAMPAGAQTWDAVTETDAIVALLTAQDLVYEDGATQSFRPSGRTLYTFGEPSWGHWRVMNGQYCSQWPPGDDWDCYDLSHDGGVQVRFSDAWGNHSVGQFAQ